MKRNWRLFAAVGCLLLFGLGNAVACENWECKTVPAETAQCWERYGPEANQYPYAMACTILRDCMGGTCTLWCEYDDYCFSV